MTAGRRTALPCPRRHRHGTYLLPLAVALALHGAAVAGFVILPERQPSPTDLVLSIELVNEQPGDAGAEARVGGTAPPDSDATEHAVEAASETGLAAVEAPTGAARKVRAVEPEPAAEADALAAQASPRPVAEPGPEPDAAEAIELVKGSEQQAAPTRPQVLIADVIAQPPPVPVRKPPRLPKTPVLPARALPLERAAAEPVAAASPAEPAARAVAPEGAAPGRPASSTSTAARSTPPSYVGLGGANPQPRYPYSARRRGEQGQVVLRVEVAADGRAQAVEIATSSGSHRLDAAAVQTVEHWRFRPATAGGEPVSGTVDVPITFRLED